MNPFPALVRWLVLALTFTVPVAGLRAAATQSDETAIRRDLAQLESALQSVDPTAWVYCYTEDAMFVGPGEAPVQGRPALLEMAKSMSPLRSLRLAPERIESGGTLAYAFARAHCVSGGPGAERTTRVRTLLALRREVDGTGASCRSSCMRIRREGAEAAVRTPAARCLASFGIGNKMSLIK